MSRRISALLGLVLLMLAVAMPAAQAWHAPLAEPFVVTDAFGVRSIPRQVSGTDCTGQAISQSVRVNEQHGLDLRAQIIGTDVLAVADARIEEIRPDTGGTILMLTLRTDATFSPHGLSHTVRYLHLDPGTHNGVYQYVAPGGEAVSGVMATALPNMGGNGLVIWRANGVTQTVYLATHVRELPEGENNSLLNILATRLSMTRPALDAAIRYRVTAGEVVVQSGDTGSPGSPHLHVDVDQRSNPVNALTFLTYTARALTYTAHAGPTARFVAGSAPGVTLTAAGVETSLNAASRLSITADTFFRNVGAKTSSTRQDRVRVEVTHEDHDFNALHAYVLSDKRHAQAAGAYRITPLLNPPTMSVGDKVVKLKTELDEVFGLGWGGRVSHGGVNDPSLWHHNAYANPQDDDVWFFPNKISSDRPPFSGKLTCVAGILTVFGPLSSNGFTDGTKILDVLPGGGNGYDPGVFDFVYNWNSREARPGSGYPANAAGGIFKGDARDNSEALYPDGAYHLLAWAEDVYRNGENTVTRTAQGGGVEHVRLSPAAEVRITVDNWAAYLQSVEVFADVDGNSVFAGDERAYSASWRLVTTTAQATRRLERSRFDQIPQGLAKIRLRFSENMRREGEPGGGAGRGAGNAGWADGDGLEPDQDGMDGLQRGPEPDG